MAEEASQRSQRGWKEHLLRSGVPLEHEVALCLASEGIPIDADFSFLRRDVAGLKEWSVDIAANWYGPNEDRIDFRLVILAECKYRSQDKCVLLLSEPNQPDLSPITLGHTVNQFDATTPHNLPLGAFVSLEERYSLVCKGIELHERGAVEEDFRHGIQQLRYATPALLRSVFDHEMLQHRADLKPIFFTKIFVTNAPLRLLESGTNMAAIQAAKSLDEISSEIKTAILYSDYGPDFEEHFRQTFAPDWDQRAETARSLAAYLTSQGKQFRFHSDPVALMQEFADATRSTCSSVSTQFFVTTFDGLRPLIRAIKKACQRSHRHREEFKPHTPTKVKLKRSRPRNSRE